VLAHIATWDGTSALAIHNFSDGPAKASIRLPKEARSGRWRHVFGPLDVEAPTITDGRLSCELPPYGYHWFGRREGV
jgi:hypothetical protein